MIRGVILGAEEAKARFDRMPGRLREELRVGIGRSVIFVQGVSKESKLSGQVLNVRSGRLRRSITTRIEESAEGVTGIVGTNVEYAGAHEYGFDGTVSVREHLRRTKLGKEAMVRSHSRRMHLRERSFLRSALEDSRSFIRSEFEEAARRGISE